MTLSTHSSNASDGKWEKEIERSVGRKVKAENIIGIMLRE